MSSSRVLIAFALCLSVAACSTDLAGPQVFKLPGFSVKGLSHIHFGESCAHILGAAHAAGYGRTDQDSKSAKPGATMMLDHLSAPPLGSDLAMYFHCSKEHNTVTKVEFQTDAAINGAPSGFEEIKQRLVTLWGQPNSGGSQVQDTDFGQDARSYRMVGMQPPPTSTRVGYAEWSNGTVTYRLQEVSMFGSMVVQLRISPNTGK